MRTVLLVIFQRSCLCFESEISIGIDVSFFFSKAHNRFFSFVQSYELILILPDIWLKILLITYNSNTLFVFAAQKFGG